MDLFFRRPDFNALFPTPQDYEEYQRPLVQPTFPLEPPSQPSPTLARGTILSECDGTIEQLLIAIPKGKWINHHSQESIDPRLKAHYVSLLTSYPDRSFVVLASEAQRKEMQSWCEAAGKSIDFVSSEVFKYFLWAQDAFVVLEPSPSEARSGTSAVLCESVSFTRNEGMTIADDLVNRGGYKRSGSYLFFEGGNVLGGPKKTLIGRDYVWRNARRAQIGSEERAIELFEAALGTQVMSLGTSVEIDRGLLARGIVTGYGRQPIFHIDMYVTRTGCFNQEGKEIVFLGRPIKAAAVTGRFSELPELDNPMYDDLFVETHEQLATLFEVRQLPLWITYGNVNDPTKARKYYTLTWNNVLVENDGDDKRVVMPSYVCDPEAKRFGLTSEQLEHRRLLEAAARHEWEQLGFKVHLTHPMEDLALGDGAVHCLTKVLKRRRSARLLAEAPR